MPIFFGVVGLLGLGAVVILGLASRQPATFRVERKQVVGAPPSAVFPRLEDFHRWPEWSPWEKVDPALQRTYGGAERGEGATYEWRGNSKAGQGRMTILESRPSERVVIRLEFIKPFPAINTTTFTVTPAPGGGSEVGWAMEGPTTLMTKVMSLFTSMDAFLGPQFEEGLANLKRASESSAPASPPPAAA